MKRALLIAGLALVSCRTEIQPIVRGAPVKKQKAKGVCEVHDYQNTTDLPAGAKPLGVVKVAMQKNDDETFEKLRKEICALGGDGVSQMHWLRPSGASVADSPTELEGNAWILP